MFTEFAPAKINLYLHVLGRRQDGYHAIDSLVVFADVGDSVSIAPDDSGNIALQVKGDYAPALGEAEDNLVYRAAAAAQKIGGVKKGAAITLTKNLPVASGIGGGSADAAAALRALRKAWDLPDDRRWNAIAAQLGADVPVCLASRTSRISGKGEIVAPADFTGPGHVVLVNPNRPLPTKDVFARYKGNASTCIEHNNIAALRGTRNDLTDAALLLMPEIKTALEALARQPGCALARMSGSGATCFGLFEKEAPAAAAAQAIQAEQPGWWVRAARIAYEGRHGQAQ